MALHLDEHPCHVHCHSETSVWSFLLTFHPSLSWTSVKTCESNLCYVGT